MADTYLQSLLGQNERVVLITRQHWFVLLRAVALELILVIIIAAAVSLAALYFPLAAVAYALALLPAVRLVYDCLIWWNRMFVVTSRRVVQVAGVVNKNVIDSSLEKVNDVKMEQSFFGRMFDYGDVEILTASELAVNRFERIADPIRFKTAMLNAKEAMGHEDLGLGDLGAVPADDIPALIANLDQLRKQGVLTEEEFQAKKRDLLAKM